MATSRWFVAFALTYALSLAGCELIADFESGDSEDMRTVPPTGIPSLDGATPILVDGSVRDAAVVRAPDDAGVISSAAASGLRFGMDAGNESDLFDDIR